jgi:predicted nucleic acid-binding protein
MRLVVDASVAVKWVLPDPAIESDADRAAALLNAFRENRLELIQPPHWLAEVAAVISRLRPEVADEAVDLLDALELAVEADAEIYKRASRIARQFDHHLFDTLYHALALERDAVLVTADDRYLRKAGALGGIVSLGDWIAPTAAADDKR